MGINSPSPSFDVSQLPEEILLQIFHHLNEDDLQKVQLVNRVFNRVSCDNQLWQELFCQENDFENDHNFWKNTYFFFKKLQYQLLEITKENDDLNLVIDEIRCTSEAENAKLRLQNHHIRQELCSLENLIADLNVRCREQAQLIELQKMDILEMQNNLNKQQDRFRIKETRFNETSREMEELELQHKKLKELNREMKKELNEVRGVLYSEQFQISKLTRENERKDRLIVKLEQHTREKTLEIQNLKETMEKNIKDERSKRTSLERRLELLKDQFVEDSQRINKQSSLLSHRQSNLQKAADQEYEVSNELRRENRRLEREIRKNKEKYEFEIKRLKEIVGKSNQLKALSYVIMSKA